MAVTITAGAMTDIGLVRRKNQDTFRVESDLQLYLVCDGMGGAAGGEVASQVAVDTFVEKFRYASGEGSPTLSEPEHSDHALFLAAKAANRAVIDRASVEPGLHGMGSTLVAAFVEDHRLHLVNIGDSRAYLVRNGKCTQLTVDHSYLQEQVRSGLMTQAMADASSMQSVITRAVGVAELVQPDLSGLELSNRDRILLTSDGLTRHLSDEEIGSIITLERRSAANELEGCCGQLIAKAKSRGGSDNITCILLHVAIK